MSQLRAEISNRLVKFLDLDTDGRRRLVLEVILDSGEVTVGSLYKVIKKKFEMSRKVVASMVGYISSKLGILRAYKKSYRLPTIYVIREQYVDLVRSVLKSSAGP